MSLENLGTNIHNPHTKKILLAEDNQSVRRCFERILELAGFQYLSAQNGLEALSMFIENREKIFMVITDLQMPEMRGDALISALEELKFPKEAILLVSAAGSDEVSHCVRNGVNFLAKPCSVVDIQKEIQRVLMEININGYN